MGLRDVPRNRACPSSRESASRLHGTCGASLRDARRSLEAAEDGGRARRVDGREALVRRLYQRHKLPVMTRDRR